ncbi:MAG: RAD55 family ATPase [Candidatus Hodarchaeales archaeon]
MADSLAVKFGQPELDDIFGGGLSPGTTILLEDEIGVSAKPLVIQFLSEGLFNGEYTYIVATESLYEDYRSLLIPFGIDEIVVETKRLVYIDAFSNPFGYRDARKATGFDNIIKDLSQPRTITDSIRQALLHVRTQNVRGVLDSFSTVLLYTQQLQSPLAFLQYKIASDRANGHITLFTIHADVHPPEVVRAVEHYFNIVLRIEKQEGQDTLNVAKTGDMYTTTKKAQFKYRPGPGRIELDPL